MDSMTYAEALAHWARTQPDAAALTCGERSLTFSALDRRTNQLARRMAAIGIKRGDWIAIALPNSTDFVEAVFATSKIGGRILPLSPKLPLPELMGILELAKPVAIFQTGENSFEGYSVIAPDDAELAKFPDQPLPSVTVDRAQAMTSGGSSGRPKMVVKPTANSVLIDGTSLEIRPREVVLVPGPLYHGAPFTYTVTSILRGCHAVVMPRFDAEQTLALVEAYKANVVLFVPTMMHRIWQLDEAIRSRYDLTSLRVIVHMGAPCAPWLKRAFIHWLGPQRVHEFYSQTEQLCFTWITGDEWLSHPGSIGRVTTGKVRVLDEDGRELPSGEIGEIYIMPDSGPGTTYHYVGAESRRTPDGWETTGDVGYVDSDGYVFLSDRRTDMILSGGANIYPAEVEAAIDEHPDVITSAVVGLPDDDLGNRVHAIVQVTKPIAEYDMQQWVKARLVPYKVPRSFEFVTATLRADAGKLRRAALRAERMGKA